MKKNMKNFINFVRSIEAKECRKLPMDNIILPSFQANKIVGLLFRQMVRTKEQPEGCLYDEGTYQVVLRVINGHLLMNGMLDAYAWKRSKVEKAACEPIGCVDGLDALERFAASIKDEEERQMVLDFFNLFNFDMKLAHTGEEERKCIEVTQELFDAGLTYSVDEWMPVDDNGDADATELNVGDFLIVTDKGAYCVRMEEFLQTHELI